MARLFTFHSRGLTATYADLENQALAQGEAPLTTPGSVLVRTNAGGFRFYALQQYDHDGERQESYLAGPIGDRDAEETAARARQRISELRDVLASIRLLVREGYLSLERKHYLAIAALANHGFFAGGGMLVGSHAFEAMLNRMAIRASGFPTTDVDVARPAKLKLKEWRTLHVPELKAHALTAPYFRYLVSESQPGVVMSPIGCTAVRIPVPERFAVHKLLVSQLRIGKSEKAQKDLRQAAIVIAALAELQPGTIAEAFAKTPVSARSKIVRSMTAARPLLADHPVALEEIDSIVATQAKRTAR